MAELGIVVIGRNEGERLVRCLNSIAGYPAIYVDSGSTDGSVAAARGLGVGVEELDLNTPFTAARARNAGWRALLAVHPELTFVMFVDGDCEVVPGWIAAAMEALAANPNLAAVCGRRRERHPDASPYNLLCDMEWDTPVGPARATGGDAVFRISALVEVDGFDPGFIAGEEPELCYRLRQRGAGIARLPVEMTLHDAAMTRFGQWWKRTQRSGYAYYLGAAKHGAKPPEYYNARDVRSILVWGGGMVLLLVAALILASGWPLLLGLALLGLQTARVFQGERRRRASFGSRAAMLYAGSVMVGKLAQLQGVLQGWLRNRRGRSHTLVEYK